MKRSKKAVRRFMAFLAAVCMLGTMPGLPRISYAEENRNESLETYDIGADGQEENPEDPVLKGQTGGPVQEAGETAKEAGNPEDAEGKEAEDKRNPEEPDKKDKENGEDTEESENRKDTGKENTEDTEGGEKTGEAGTDKEDIPDKEDPEESEKPEEIPEGAQDTKGEETGAGDEGITGEETDEEGETTGEEEAAGEGEITGEEEIAGEEEITGEEEIAGEEEITVEEETADEAETEESGETDIVLLSAQTADSGTVQDDNTYTDENGVVYHYYAYDDGTAEIYELENYRESTWDYRALNIPAQVGGYTVTRLTFTISQAVTKLPSVTIPETVTYMAGSLFRGISMTELHYNAEAAETGADGEGSGAFSLAYIGELHIGENVKVIPDYCFANAKITMDELTLNVESIGDKAFYYNKTITTLTIGEDVRAIGDEAFSRNQIENINYFAVNAMDSAKYGQIVYGPFGYVSVSNITIGDKVAMIPEHLFCSIDYTADALVFPECLTTVGAMAFYGDDIAIGELTIGENVTSLGTEAFARGKIGVLNYDAVDARQDGVTETNRYRAAFEGVDIGELRIGEKVKTLPDSFLCGTSLVQDTLRLPDSITCIGSHVLSYGAGKIKIGTLEVGENVAHIGRAAFAGSKFDRVVVRTVTADVPPRSDMDIELPKCSEIEIHGKSPYYDFFTTRTDKGHITLLCEDFTTTRGEEYYDAEKQSFVTPITDACTVCGYETTRNEYSEACTVIFTDYDGSELSRQHLHKGDDAAAPKDPERTGWRFTGWDRSYTNVVSDLTVKAEYEIRTFSVVFKDGGRILSEQEVRYGDSVEAPENPTRPEEEWGSWKFTGWSGSYANITKDEVITAQFEKALNQYEVLFYDAEGNVISRQTVAHGENAKEPEIPEKEPTAQYHYTFTGWSASTEGITGDTAFYPVYGTETRSYTVTFRDGSTVLDTQTVAYGNDATAPADPTREKEVWGSWQFTGWRGSYTNIAKDEAVWAVFEKILNTYEVTFCDAEGNVISRQTVVHGEDATEPEIPEKEPTAQYHYTFTGWSASTEGITGDTAFYPVYDAGTRSYTVTFMDGDTVLDTQTVKYGEDAAVPDDPARPEEEWGSWKFTGWSGSYTHIAKDEVIRAVFEKVLNEYEVIFYDADDNILSRQTIKHGMGAKVPKAPAMEPTERECYVFAGWDGDVTHITEESRFHPLYETKTRTYTVTFMNGDITHDVQEVAYGQPAATPQAPSRKADASYTYRFAGWDKDFSFITGDLTVQAVFEPVEKPEDGEPEEEKPKDKEPGGQEPGDGDGDGGQEPGDDGGDGGTDGEADGGGQPDTEPTGDGGENPEPVAGIPAQIILSQGAQPQAAQEKKPAFPVPEIPEKSIQPEEKGGQTKEAARQETLQEEDAQAEEGHEHMPFWPWLLLLLGAGVGILHIILLCIFDGKRTVCGTVLDSDGNAVRGIQVSLAGQEAETMETQTDKNGQYMFDGLEKGDYRLCLCSKDDTGLLLLDIHMGRCRSKKVFSIYKSHVGSVGTKRSGRKYQVDVTV